MPAQFLLCINEERTPERSKAGMYPQHVIIEKESFEACEAAFPDALKMMRECPYVATIRIGYQGEQPDAIKEIATNTGRELKANVEYKDGEFKRVPIPEIPIPVPTKAEQIAELERVKVDAEAQLAVLKAEEAAK